MANKWPTLKAQLREAKAPPGSAFEQLIKDNQDVHMLHPSEAEDDFELPLWLRVYWRKNHLDVPLSEVNPGASYPENLDDVQDWMAKHPDLPWGPQGGPKTSTDALKARDARQRKGGRQ